jgi:hypothetical protein
LDVGNPARVEITVKPGAWVDPVRVVHQISYAGYTPIRSDFTLTVTGRIVVEERPSITIEGLNGGSRTFTLVQGEDQDPKRATAFAEAYRGAGGLADKIVEARLRITFEQEKHGLRWRSQAVLEAVRAVK